jgi:hypothetical protein
VAESARGMHRRRLLIALVLVPAAVLATAAAAYAGFFSIASASQPVSTAAFQPATSVTATQVNCRNNQTPKLSVGWTASSSGFTTGYTIYRGTTSGGPYTSIGSVSAATTTFADPSTTLAYTQSYYYVVDATFLSWSSRSAEASIATLSNKCA